VVSPAITLFMFCVSVRADLLTETGSYGGYPAWANG
jgi:hypothetical protein